MTDKIEKNLKKIRFQLDQNIKNIEVINKKLIDDDICYELIFNESYLNHKGQIIKINKQIIDLNKYALDEIYTIDIGKFIACKKSEFNMEKKEEIDLNIDLFIQNKDTFESNNIEIKIPISIYNNIHGYGSYRSSISYNNDDVIPLEISRIKNMNFSDISKYPKFLEKYLVYWLSLEENILFKELMYSTLLNDNFFPMIDKKRKEYCGIWFINEPKLNIELSEKLFNLQLTFNSLEIISEEYFPTEKNFTISLRIINRLSYLQNKNYLCDSKLLNFLIKNKEILLSYYNKNGYMVNYKDILNIL